MAVENNRGKGMYTPELESDACGIGMIANLNGAPLHSLVSDALTVLENMEHRGACGCEANTGDGAGILSQIPHEFFLNYARSHGYSLPEKGKYGVGFLFLPKKNELRSECMAIIKNVLAEKGFELLFVRDVPVDNSMIGLSALSTEPVMIQLFIKDVDNLLEDKQLEKRLYVLRNEILRAVVREHPSLKEEFYFPSFSCRTIVYKGQLTAAQVRPYFPDLSDTLFKSAVALVHSRFSTNTVPKWKLAQPFRCIAHNGEINTVQGNVNWWNAREKDLVSKTFSPKDLEALLPVCSSTLSDSGNFDAVLEFLIREGLSVPHALMMMIPEAWHDDSSMPQYKKEFYEFHEYIMEPWDGPASIVFTDGKVLGATLDRNGLRPSKYCLTKDNILILGSESGVLSLDQSKIIYKGNLMPGQILIADLDLKKIVGDEELKNIVCNNRPYGDWLKENRINIEDLPPGNSKSDKIFPLLQRQIALGFTKEDEELIISTMIKDGKEPIGSMGSDIPLAVLSTQAQHLSHYFKQQFAQVTNPPIDPIRERPFMSLEGYLGGSGSVINSEAKDAAVIRIKSPVLREEDFEKLMNTEAHGISLKSFEATFNAESLEDLESTLDKIKEEVEAAVLSGVKIVVLDNTQIAVDRAAVPSLMTLGAIHHHLIAKGLRRRTSLVVKAGDATEVHHFATLCGYGADAIYPELTYETIKVLASQEGMSYEKAEYYYKKAIDEGLLKVMSKLGISTMLSYKGAQAFECVGISKEVINKCFKGTISRIEGMTFVQLAKENVHKHFVAFEAEVPSLIESGRYQWKRRGEFHLFNPASVHLLQQCTKTGDYNTYKKYTEAINDQSKRACTLRSLFKFKKGKPIPLSQVEPAESIMRRFATGAMSFGSISEEAHTTLAIAMNRIGGKSNSGEGGEDSARYKVRPNGDLLRSAIKQVASGRFGVTIEYLNNADELQIKMAQGAKPGEGGQLPGHKVDETIARIRHSTPGVGLISPPPHHDIYSIEDLAQLIFDLKNSNRDARISVKLVSKAGVGIIASGVAKAHADHILISGFDGGTGASPVSSIMHAGLPWEMGLSETHQTLVKNGLRDRVVLQTDGQIRTGRDMAIATLLGAEEWGIATAALVVSGCIMMRKCHLNTCPVGVATQDPELRAKFDGKVEYLINYFRFLAQDLREIMAELGFRTVNDMVGKSNLLEADIEGRHWKYQNLDLSPIFYVEKSPKGYENQTHYQSVAQDHGIDYVLDRQLIKYSNLAIKDKIQINSIFPVKSTDRAVGTMLSSEIARRYGAEGLPPESIMFRFRGSAGQSFGAFGARGLEFILEGEANDYFGKGLSGATLVVVPDRDASFEASENIIIGNVAFFGATSGKAFVKGVAGERFCVRNSGAEVVVEGVGHNGCEYMTGGRVIILGKTGRNFAAGMSGGIAYIHDVDRKLKERLNLEMVLVEEPDETDFEYIRKMVREHFRLTSSMNALQVLQNWDKIKHDFVKIIPSEYKAVMQKMLNGGTDSSLAKLAAK